jgi:hypothetical protein
MIDTLEAVHLGETTQWIRVRSTDVSNPLLLIQQGPDLPVFNEVRRFDRLLGLEEDFTVDCWDQRGCGRSLRSRQDRLEVSVERMVGDTGSNVRSRAASMPRSTSRPRSLYGGLVGAPGRIRTCAHGSGGRCSIP